MGHRALVAYRQHDGTFTLRYAHWGNGLAAAIGPDAPLGGIVRDLDTNRIGDRLDVNVQGGYDPPVATRVDPRPLVTGAAAADVLDALDPAYETLIVVSPVYEATPYLVCSLDPTTAGADLVLARPEGDPESLRTWFVETKSRISAAVADDTISPGAARAALRRTLAARATLYSTDDASFLRDQ